MDNTLISQHKRLAMQGGDPQESGNFGVERLDATHKPHSEPGGGRKRLKDGARGISRPRGFHPEPDHGPTD